MANKELLDYKTTDIQAIIAWCSANKKVEWLKATAASRPQFFTLKKAFFEAFMPEAIPVKKAKKPTMYDIINAL